MARTKKFHILWHTWDRFERGDVATGVIAACEKPNEVERVDWLTSKACHMFAPGIYTDADTGTVVLDDEVCVHCQKAIVRAMARGR